jgi:hypothetical protein
LIGQIFSIAQEEDRKNRNHQNSGESRRSGLFYIFNGPLYIRAVALEEDSDPIGLFIGPTQIVSELTRNFSGGDFVRQDWDFLQKLARVPAEIWKEIVGTQRRQNDDCEIGFQNVRPSEIFEEKRMPLQKPDDRINEICEQNRKGENNDDRARDVNDGKRERKEENCQQYARRPAIREHHKPTFGLFQSGFPTAA